jgi:hypothetical protein
MLDHDAGAPTPDEYAPYDAKYISLVPEGAIVATLAHQVGETLDRLRAVSEAEADLRQPPYTWSFKDVVGHMADTERVMAYRALRIARGDQTPLPGFDQDEYVRVANFGQSKLSDLAAEFLAAREGTLRLFRNLDKLAWNRLGRANDTVVSVRALAWIIAGHERHHAAILRERVKRFRS